MRLSHGSSWVLRSDIRQGVFPRDMFPVNTHFQGSFGTNRLHRKRIFYSLNALMDKVRDYGIERELYSR
jgi:hypothetical protein